MSPPEDAVGPGAASCLGRAAPRERLVLATLLVVAAALWLCRYTDRPLTGDSVRYAAISRRMVETGDWAQPQTLGEPDWWKPPLSYWLVASTMEVLGPTSLAAMLPSIVAGILLVLAIFLVTERWAGPIAGVTGALLVLFNPGFMENTSTDRLESLLQVFGLGALVAAEKARARPAWFAAFGALLGAAVLTKGAVGLVPLVLLAVTALVTRSAYPFDRRAFRAALPVALLVAGPWYAIMSWRHGATFWATHFGVEVAARVGPHDFEQVGRSLLASFAYVWLLAPLAVCGAVLAWRDARREPSLRRPAALATTWIVLIAGAQAFGSAAFARYMYNALVPLAGLAGYGVARLAGARAARVAAVAAASIALAGVVVFRIAAPEPPAKHRDHRAVLDELARDATPGPVLVVSPEAGYADAFVWFHLHRPTRVVAPDRLAATRAADPDAFAGRLAVVDDRGARALEAGTFDVVRHANVYSLVRFR